jgi:hypothetical protein
MESPHLYQLVVNNPCDTIYHEHFSYLSILTVSRILAGFGLKMFDVESCLPPMADHCGSSPVMKRPEGNRRPGRAIAEEGNNRWYGVHGVLSGL